jgi:ATP-dependent RNA helicase DeaD
MMTNTKEVTITFKDLALSAPVLKAVEAVGYDAPSPIQAQIIPLMLDGHDVVGQAQTGTGKTAAFALPILSKIDAHKRKPQALVLVPTRELAIQVSEAFQRYASGLPGLGILPLYGGQDYEIQLRQLRRGAHVIVGTPGRVMDHLRRHTLRLEGKIMLVLDEADEMLNMGFLEDVKWILEQIPAERQTALFSATLPSEIRIIAHKYLKSPKEVTVKMRTKTADKINQHYWLVDRLHKLDALSRILEAEPVDGALVFVRTKTETVELSEKLNARGFATAPLNGDLKQKDRERTVDRLKNGQLDILVATDIAARGLDVKRISHVFNYDIPFDTETYIHRVGRTGRAGASGEAIIFISAKEKRMLYAIEKATGKAIKPLVLPTADAVNQLRIVEFKNKLSDALADPGIDIYTGLLEKFIEESGQPPIKVAAAMAKLLQGKSPFLLEDKPFKPEAQRPAYERPSNDRDKPFRKSKTFEKGDEPRAPRDKGPADTYKVNVGRSHGLEIKHLVGAIANEGGLRGTSINHIRMYDTYATVDLPAGLSSQVIKRLQATLVAGRPMGLVKMEGKHKG